MKELKREPRDWQLDAKRAEIEYRANGGQKPLAAACPGSGKTTLGVMFSCQFFNEEGGELVLVIAPTINIKLAWAGEFKHNGFTVSTDVKNQEVKDRILAGRSIKEALEVICVTYDQLSSREAMTADGESLYAEYCRRYKTYVIADEVHHADDAEAYGKALEAVAAPAARRLALSGTPFNTRGGALAMCDTEVLVDDTGALVRHAVPFYEYSYGDALIQKVCRLAEFGIVYGKAQVTYESLLDAHTFTRLIDLSCKRKDDSLRPILDPDGDFLSTLLSEGVARLGDLKQHHRRAAMLVVAIDGAHAAKIVDMLEDICGPQYNIHLILHDTEAAHSRIEALENDNTDIVVTVRMISEGIDVKRFRVGVYASDARTQLFFVQFVGRFLRWQSDLGPEQHAWIIFPGHVLLVQYAEMIEKMIVETALRINGDGEAPPEPKSMRTRVESEATDQETMARGTVLPDDDETLVDSFLTRHPLLKGRTADSTLAEILRAAHYEGATAGEPRKPEAAALSQKHWRDRNAQLANVVVKLLAKNKKLNRGALYERVNGKANRQVGITKVDSLVPIEVLQKRLSFLKGWVASLQRAKTGGGDVPGA